MAKRKLFTAAILTRKHTCLSRARGPEAANVGDVFVAKPQSALKAISKILKSQ